MESAGDAYLAVNEVQSADAVSRERRVRTSAHLACDVLGNILSQQTFNVLERELSKQLQFSRAHVTLQNTCYRSSYLWDELSSDHQTLATVNGSFRSQLYKYIFACSVTLRINVVPSSIGGLTSHEELEHVLWITVHHLADLLEVHPQSLLRTN